MNRHGSGKPSPLHLALILAAGLLLTYVFATRGSEIARLAGYPLDDAWIHATFARNLAHGDGYSFNRGEMTGGATAPLFVFLLAAAYALFGPQVWISLALGVASNLLTAALVYLTLLLLVPGPRWIALLGGLVVSSSPLLAWASLSGMETTLYALLLVAGIYAHLRHRPTLAIALFCLALWVRPEAVLLVAASLVLTGARAPIRAFVTIANVIAYGAFNQIVGGSPLPHSVVAKVAPQAASIAQVAHFLYLQLPLWILPSMGEWAATQSPALLCLAVAGVGLAWRSRRAVLVVAGGYLVLHELGFAFVTDSAGPQYRYVLPLLPLVAILAGVGAGALLGRLRPRLEGPAMAVVAAAVLVPQLVAIPAQATNYAWNVQNINGMHRFLGELLREKTAPRDTVATNDIGAIGYFSGRYIVDPVGLINPKLPLPEFLTRYRPRLLIVFPNWYREYSRVDSVEGGPYFYDADSTYRYWGLFGVELRHNTVVARDKIFTFVRLPREKPPPADHWMYRH